MSHQGQYRSKPFYSHFSHNHKLTFGDLTSAFLTFGEKDVLKIKDLIQIAASGVQLSNEDHCIAAPTNLITNILLWMKKNFPLHSEDSFCFNRMRVNEFPQ